MRNSYIFDFDFGFSLKGVASSLQTIFGQAAFYAPLTTSLFFRGTGSATFTRASTATVMGYGPTANLTDGQTLLTVDSGEARFVGARRISANNWSDTFADGTPIPEATLLGYLSEGAATNYFLNSGAPVTQTISLPTGTFTLGNILGSGSITSSAGTATATGYGVATSSATNTITVTVAGTVVFTVSGTVTQAQVENTAFATSYIPTAGAAVTRAPDALSYTLAGNLNQAAGSAYVEIQSFIVAGSSTPDGRVIGTLNAPGSPMFIENGWLIGSYDNATAVQTTAGAAGIPYKGATSWGMGRTSIKNGGTPATGAYAGSFGMTTLAIGGDGGTLNQSVYGTVKNVRIWQTQLPDATLQAITA